MAIASLSLAQPASMGPAAPFSGADHQDALELEKIAAELDARGDGALAQRLRRVANRFRSRVQSPAYSPVPGVGSPPPTGAMIESSLNTPFGSSIQGVGAAATTVVNAFRGEILKLSTEERLIKRDRQVLASRRTLNLLTEEQFQANQNEIDAREEGLKRDKSAFAEKVRSQSAEIVKELDKIVRSAPEEERHQIQIIRSFFLHPPEDDEKLFQGMVGLYAQSTARLMQFSIGGKP